MVPLWSTFNQIAIFGQFRDFWCENVFTAHLWAKPCDFCPLNMSYIHISELPMRWLRVPGDFPCSPYPPLTSAALEHAMRKHICEQHGRGRVHDEKSFWHYLR